MQPLDKFAYYLQHQKPEVEVWDGDFLNLYDVGFSAKDEWFYFTASAKKSAVLGTTMFSVYEVPLLDTFPKFKSFWQLLASALGESIKQGVTTALVLDKNGENRA